MTRPTPTSPARLADLMADIDAVLTRRHATTQEVIEAARQMAVSAAAQMADDCPGASRTGIIRAVVADLERALSLRLMLFAGGGGEA